MLIEVRVKDIDEVLSEDLRLPLLHKHALVQSNDEVLGKAKMGCQNR